VYTQLAGTSANGSEAEFTRHADLVEIGDRWLPAAIQANLVRPFRDVESFRCAPQPLSCDCR
jgi:hypothetical protein